MNIESKIEECEKSARKLEWPQLDIEGMHEKVWNYCQHFIQTLDSSPTYYSHDNQGQHLKKFTVSSNGYPIEELIDTIAKDVDQTGINPAHGGHMGYVPGGGILISALGDLMAAITNRYAGIYFANPGAVRMENYLIRWMANFLGMPASSSGNLASGGSVATLTAMVSARDAFGICADNVRQSVIYLTDYLHHCVSKAIRIAGLRECPVRNIPTNEEYSMDTTALISQIERDIEVGFRPFLVCASAGTTDTGAIDPLFQIHTIAARYKMWFHIDAAYGGFFKLLPETKPILDGIHLADSIVIDPHKSFFLPYGIGAVIVRDTHSLYSSHRYTAAYMQDADFDKEELSPADLSPELTKHFRGMRMWLPLHVIGIEPFKAALREKMLLCNYFVHHIKEAGFEIGPKPKLSIAIFRWGKGEKTNILNQKLIKKVHENGNVFISSTTIDSVFWLRVAIVCFRTHKHHVDYLLELLKSLLSKLEYANQT